MSSRCAIGCSCSQNAIAMVILVDGDSHSCSAAGILADASKGSVTNRPIVVVVIAHERKCGGTAHTKLRWAAQGVKARLGDRPQGVSHLELPATIVVVVLRFVAASVV